MKHDARVGCCGFGMARERYFEQFSSVEVQNTFYEPPQIATLKKWRAEAPSDFEFAIKAWQLITHESKSPTYRRLKRELSEQERTECGAFRLTPIVKEAWARTIQCAHALKASKILFQCPASFTPTPAHLKNIRQFFETVDRPANVDLFWEPRGAWTDDVVHALCKDLSLFHAVDPFLNECVTPEYAYYRLHGRTGWRYNYTEEDLLALKKLVSKNYHARTYFNNVTMTKDAASFMNISD